MRFLPRRWMPLVVVVATTAGAAQRLEASPIVYTFTGTGTGSIGSTDFVDAAFTIVQTSDTSLIEGVAADGLFKTPVGSATTITIEGIGVATFTDGARIFVNQPINALGLQANTFPDFLDLFEPEFGTYDLKTSIGPIFEASPSAVAGFVVDTNLGLLDFSDIVDVTFTASTAVVPEPSTLALAAIGGVGVVGVIRRRRRS